MQNGLLLCTAHSCLDDTLMFLRDEIIANRISENPEELKNMTAEKRRNPNNVYQNRPA